MPVCNQNNAGFDFKAPFGIVEHRRQSWYRLSGCAQGADERVVDYKFRLLADLLDFEPELLHVLHICNTSASNVMICCLNINKHLRDTYLCIKFPSVL